MQTHTSAIPGSFLPLNILLVAFMRPEGNQSRKYANRSVPSKLLTAAVNPVFRPMRGYMVHYLCVAQSPSCVSSETLWTTACQGPLSVGFSRQEYQSGLPFPPLGDRPDPGVDASPAIAGRFFTRASLLYLLLK